jgi:alkanesulfonate monooxygenase SsuD/methylene tetrahydromethanopterin reductase-like flavin-dependent oxidoreductase (luciferase family)
VQAGSSEDGRQLAARFADVIFTAQISLEDAVEFYDDMKARVRREGRDPDQVLVMPGFMAVVAETREEAEDRLAQIDRVIVRDHALAQLSEYLHIDATSLDLDAPLPAHVGTDARSETNKSRFGLIVKLARREHLTVRQLLTRVGGGRGHFVQAGTASEIADTMQQWFDAGATDGFNVMAPVLPADLKSFSALVMPELRRRGLIGDIPTDRLTLRQRLGLASV